MGLDVADGILFNFISTKTLFITRALLTEMVTLTNQEVTFTDRDGRSH